MFERHIYSTDRNNNHRVASRPLRTIVATGAERHLLPQLVLLSSNTDLANNRFLDFPCCFPVASMCVKLSIGNIIAEGRAETR